MPSPTPLELLQNRLSASKLQQLMESLATDTRFQLYLESVRQMRETAIQDVCNDAVIQNPALLHACIGEIRTFNSLLSLVTAQPPAQ